MYLSIFSNYPMTHVIRYVLCWDFVKKIDRWNLRMHNSLKIRIRILQSSEMSRENRNTQPIFSCKIKTKSKINMKPPASLLTNVFIKNFIVHISNRKINKYVLCNCGFVRVKFRILSFLHNHYKIFFLLKELYFRSWLIDIFFNIT